MKRYVPAAMGMMLILTQFRMAADPLDSWILYDPGTNVTLEAVCYGGGLFVAVGYTEGGFQNGQYSGNALILTSYNGIDWNQEAVTNVNWLSGVAYGDGLFVAVGQNSDPSSEYDNVALTSQDGLEWNQAEVASGYWFGGITYGNGLFVAAAGIRQTATILTSPDGIDWTQYDYGNSPAYGVAYGTNGFLAVQLNGQTLASSGGANWTNHSVGGGYDTRSVGFGNGMYVAVGSSNSQAGLSYGAMLTSPDGLTWTPRACGATNLLDSDLNSAAWCAGQFIVTGDGGLMLTSSNGVNWTLRDSGTDSDLSAAACGNGVYVAVGDVILTTGQLAHPVLQISPPDNGPPVMQMTASAGYNYMAESSLDLVQWTSFGILTNTNGIVLFTDPDWTNSAAKFYRVKGP